MFWWWRTNRIFFVLAVTCFAIGVEGYRRTTASWGAKSEPDKISLASVNVGTAFANGHLEITDFFPLSDYEYSGGGATFIPLAPLSPGSQIPTEKYMLDGAARDTRIIVQLSSREDIVKLLAGDCRGLVMGTAESACPSTVKNVLSMRLDIQEIEKIAVLELGRTPSVTTGILMMIAGCIGTAFMFWVTLKYHGDA